MRNFKRVWENLHSLYRVSGSSHFVFTSTHVKRFSNIFAGIHWRNFATRGYIINSPNTVRVTALHCKNLTTIQSLLLVPNSTIRMPATDMLYNTTNGRAHNNSTTSCTTNSPPTDKNLPYSNVLTCPHVGLWHCDVANLLYNKLYNCCELVHWRCCTICPWCP